MSKLTDLEICQRIAEIEGVELMPYRKGDRTTFEAGSQTIYSPLTDDALCFRLMVKYDVWRWSNPREGKFNACIKGVQGWLSGESPNKAICLAIIESKESK
jgi:hypothetical protein